MAKGKKAEGKKTAQKKTARGSKARGSKQAREETSPKSPEPVESAPPLGAIALSSVLFCVSGVATFIHEVCWTRLGRWLLGGDGLSVSVVVASILFGLGVGALLADRVQRRFGSARGFAVAEAAAGALSLSLLVTVPIADQVLGSSLVLRSACAIFLFSAPGLAIGASLPLLSTAKFGKRALSTRAGTLYAVHALGGAVASIATAFWLLPDLGLTASIGLASALQFAVAGAAFFGLKTEQAKSSALKESPKTKADYRIVAAVTAAGVATAALQVLWTRTASFTLGPSVQGFALVVAAYVLALALGSGIAAQFSAKSKNPALIYSLLTLLSGASVLFFLSNMESWTISAAAVYEDAAEDGVSWIGLAQVTWPAIIVPIALSAAAFPFAVEALLRAHGRKESTAAVGWIVGPAALGNVLGALGASVWLIPKFGLAGGFFCAAGSLALGALLMATSALKGGPGRRSIGSQGAAVFLGAGGLFLLAGFTAPKEFDADRLTRGPFLYSGPRSPDLGAVIFNHHGRDATVTVREGGGDRILQINGKIDGSGRGDGATQVLAGLLPAMLSDSPEHALVIGLGTGTTASAVRFSPGVEHTTVVELLPGVRYAAPAFRHWNESVLEDEHVSYLEGDAAQILRHGTESYDLIVSEPSNPWVDGMGALFSVEAFENARARLSDDGIFAVWFHVYSTDIEIIRSLVATFLTSFPQASLWELARGQDYLLVGHKTGADFNLINLDQLTERFRDPDAQRTLGRAGINTLESLLSRFVMSGDSLADFSRDSPALTMMGRNLESRAARSLYQDASLEALAAFGEHSSTETEVRTTATTEAALAALEDVPASIEAGALGRTLLTLAAAGDEDGAIAAGERAIGLLPHDPTLREDLATLYLARGKLLAITREPDAASDAFHTVLELEPSARLRSDALTGIGDLLLGGEEYQRALAKYQAARRLQPNLALLAERIAECLEALGASDDARQERELAERLNRLNR